MQFGVRQARYVGRAKTLCQLLLAATVANLTLVATKVGLIRDRHHRRARAAAHIVALLTSVLPVCHLVVALRRGGTPWTPAYG